MSTTADIDDSTNNDSTTAITTDAPSSEMDVSVVADVPDDVYKDIVGVLADMAREREKYLKHVEDRIRKVVGTATRSGWNIDAFAEGVWSRIRHVRADGANVHDNCVHYAFGGRDYDTLRSVRDEHEIRLRLDSAQAELDVMESALESSPSQQQQHHMNFMF